MELSYDARADAAFVYLDGPLRPGTVDGTERLDQDRNIKFDAADQVLAYEFLNVRRYGVRLDDLDHRDELRALFNAAGVAERDWGAAVGGATGAYARRGRGCVTAPTAILGPSPS